MRDVLATAREVLAIEAEGLTRLMDRLGEGFALAVDLILASPGKVITTGIGKSGIIARKIMATLNSTGTTSIFLHPVEALHGDLGLVSAGDVVVAISHSGRTEELVALLPQLRHHKAKVVAMTGGLDSPLALGADAVIDCGVAREACPLGLAPTASTTAALAMGDALAVVLLEAHQFKAEDFRYNHPGGSLGQRLNLSVGQIMAPLERVPVAEPEANAAQAVAQLDAGDLGTVLITRQGRLAGIYTDGDVRRGVVAGVDFGARTLDELMTADPKTIGPGASAAEALQIMERLGITALPVVDAGHKVLGLVHLHDLLGRGTVSLGGIIQSARNGRE